MDKKTYYISVGTIRMGYPGKFSKVVKNLGVLEQYKGKKYTRKEINDIIATLVVRVPYISHSMSIEVNVFNGGRYHHILEFNNYNYKNQSRTDSEEVKFLYEED